MFRLLFIFLALAVGVHAADPAVVPPPPMQDFLEATPLQLAVLFLVAALMTCVMVPLCLIGWAVFIFILVMILKTVGITPQQLMMKLVQRQMMGKGKGLVWQLGVLICIPAGIFGLWTATWFFGVPAQSMSLLVIGTVCGVLVSLAFIYAAKAIAKRMSKRMMGGMDPAMMAQMMKMQGGMGGFGGMPGMGGGGDEEDDGPRPPRGPKRRNLGPGK